MTKRTILWIATVGALLAADSAPASPKPCRDKDGKVVACPKTRKPSPRCKDAQGRFVACLTDGALARPSVLEATH